MSTTFKGPVVSQNGFTGAITGNITGNVTGNVTGDLTGDSAGTHTGAVVGTTVTASTSATIGGGTAITKLQKLTVSVIIPTTAASATGDVTATATGVLAGDIILVTPLTAAMEADLAIVGAWVSATDQITIRFLNNDSGAAFTGSTSNFQVLVIRS